MLALALLCLSLPADDRPADAPPNIVLLLVDDLGWTDLGCYGSDYYRTPHIDALATRGMRFTQNYAACPVCSPTRASILTGRHPVRVDVTDWLPGMPTAKRADARFEHVDDAEQLALDEITIAETLGDAGYDRWFLGKWHLGGKGFWPTDQGFTVNIGGHHRGSPPGGYYSPWKNPVLKAKRKDEYLTERLTDEAIGLMQSRSAGQPFFLDLSYYNVHTPIQPYRKRAGEYERRDDYPSKRPEHTAATVTRQGNPQYASMVAAVDDSVGRIVAAIDELGLTDSTVIIFTSDNGGLSTERPQHTAPTSNEPLRAGKGWLYEGGIRTPLIIAGPSIPIGTSDAVTVSTDLFPTMCELAGVDKPDRPLDGVSLLPVLRGESLAPRDLIWHYPHYHGSIAGPGAVLRSGDWKLVELLHDDEIELYNLADDIGEMTDLSESHPEKRAELLGRLRDWQQSMGAKQPVPVATVD